MASWKKVIVSGSDANVKSLAVGTVSPSGVAGEISASGQVYAATAEASGLSAPYQVVVKGAGGVFSQTGSDAISPSLEALKFGDGILTPSSGPVYSGSVAVSVGVDSGSLAGNGIITNNSAGTFEVGAGNNINVSSNGIEIDTASIVDTDFGLTADAGTVGAGKIGLNLASGTGLAFNATGQLSASYVAGAALSAGNGIIMAAGNYDGSAVGTVGIASASLAGDGLDVDDSAGTIIVKGVGSLTNDRTVIYNSSTKGFESGLITDNGSLVTVGTGNTTVTIDGNLTVNGTASFTHASDVSIADPFFTMNSGSTLDTSFGIIGQTGSAQLDGIGWIYDSTDRRWAMTTGSDTAFGDAGTVVGHASITLDGISSLVDADNASAIYAKKAGNVFVDSSENIYIYS